MKQDNQQHRYQPKPKQKNTHPRQHLSTQAGACLFSLLFAILLIAGLVVATLYLLKLNDVIIKKFEGKRWDIPAKVYSQPLSLYQGASVSRADLEHTLKLLNYKPSSHFKTTGTYAKKAGHYFIHTRGFDFGDSLEKEQVLKLSFKGNQINSIQSTQLTDSGIVRLEPVLIGGIYPDNNEDRVLVNLKQVPQPLIDALIATEDRNFYGHKGISVRGTARALVSTIFGGKRQGGSTITQQLIKNFYLNSERTLKRKANEACMAILLELHYSKQEILQAYLNEINLGQNGNRSINGFGLAAQFYFNQPLSELSVDKQALLVGLAKGPSYYNPWRKPKNAKNRRNVVLNNMVVTGKLSSAEADKLKAKPLGIVKKPMAGKNRFPDFLHVVQRQLKQQYDDEQLKSQGLKIYTTLDPVVQKKAIDNFDQSILKLRKRSKRTKKLQGAMVTANPTNGELLAVVGGYGRFTGYNRVLEAKRQVGSLVKPMVYLNALASGKYNLASPVDDSPISLKVGNKTWTPLNYDKRSHGFVPLHRALAKSYNQATVRVGAEMGIGNFKKTLNNMGIEQDLPNYPSIMLGALDLTPIDVLGLYQTVAANGFRHPVNSIRSVIDAQGKTLQRSELAIKQSLNPASAYLLNYALQQVVNHGTAKSLKTLGSGLKLAGKTGTTNDYKDAWFAGYSGNYVSVVWVGNDDNSATGLSGSSGALPVWKRFMGSLHLEPVSLAQPKQIQWLWLEDGSGLLTDKRCDDATFVPVIKKHAPTQATTCAQDYFRADEEAKQRALIAQQQAQAQQNQQQAQSQTEQQNQPKQEGWFKNAVKGALEEAMEWF